MNIFVLDRNPKKAARYHCDKHVVKMILETAQLLCTADYKVSGNEDTIYKPTHNHHPCTIWASESKENFKWLLELGNALLTEYTSRYGKEHKSGKVMRHYQGNIPDELDSTRGLTDFKLAMPDKYKCNDAVQSYRNYYINEKLSFAKWEKQNNIPKWILENNQALDGMLAKEFSN